MIETANLLPGNKTELRPGIAPDLSEPGTVWLDSVFGSGDRGRFSFVARRPVFEVVVTKGSVTLRQRSGAAKEIFGPDWLDYLETIWADSRLFSAGYIGYEGALPFVHPSLPNREPEIPEVRFAFYESVLQIDHLAGTARATNPDADDYADVTDFDHGDIEPCPPDPDSAGGIHTMPRRMYESHVARIKDYIREGDIYQANLTTRIDVASACLPDMVYRRLRRMSPAPYAAWLNFGDYQILSSSPERMFQKAGSSVTTGPIKGTIARGQDAREDAANLRRLINSEKDRAELLMIVDLARNDLGRVAEIGSVRVDSLFRPETYASVFHLVGDIGARLRTDATTGDVIRALLPGGSITGAPKRRAVEIIAEWEPQPRSVYTGCIGYVHGDRADFNIAIRTMVHRGGQYEVYAGGGIVADSVPSAEYDEMRLKAERMLAALGLRKETTAWPE